MPLTLATGSENSYKLYNFNVSFPFEKHCSVCHLVTQNELCHYLSFMYTYFVISNRTSKKKFQFPRASAEISKDVKLHCQPHSINFGCLLLQHLLYHCRNSFMRNMSHDRSEVVRSGYHSHGDKGKQKFPK